MVPGSGIKCSFLVVFFGLVAFGGVLFGLVAFGGVIFGFVAFGGFPVFFDSLLYFAED